MAMPVVVASRVFNMKIDPKILLQRPLIKAYTAMSKSHGYFSNHKKNRAIVKVTRWRTDNNRAQIGA